MNISLDPCFLHDQLGSAVRQTSASASLTATRTYDAYGMLVASTGAPTGPFGFAGSAGYQEDGDSGLKLLGHRYVDPSTGRFLTRDPAQDGRNWYAYCNENPLRATDPTGYFSWPVLILRALQFINSWWPHDEPPPPPAQLPAPGSMDGPVEKPPFAEPGGSLPGVTPPKPAPPISQPAPSPNPPGSGVPGTSGSGGTPPGVMGPGTGEPGGGAGAGAAGGGVGILEGIGTAILDLGEFTLFPPIIIFPPGYGPGGGGGSYEA